MTTGQLELPLFQALTEQADAERERVREMELRSYDCGVKREFHEPHVRPDGIPCPGLLTRRCAEQDRHTNHRWWDIPNAFYWCDGAPGAVYGPLPRPLFGRAVEDVELP